MELQSLLKAIAGVLAAWGLLLLTILIHETGHMLGYVLCVPEKAVPWRLEVGSGRQLLKIGRLRIRLIPFGGLFWLDDLSELPWKTAFCMTAGGPVASLLTAALLLAFGGSVFSDSLCRWLFYCNLSQFIGTAIPLSYPSWMSSIPESDGKRLLRLLKGPR